MLKRVIAIIFFMLIWSSSFGTNPQYSQSSDWNFMIAPYAWVTWTNGNVIINNLTSDINLTPEDIKNVLDSALMFHAEANKNKWTWMIDLVYFKLSANLSSNIFTFEQTNVDLGGFYQLMIKRLHQCHLMGEIYAGGRYWHMKTELSSLSNLVNRTQEWLDPIIGFRLIYCIRDKWQLVGYGDIGGFGWVSHFTWQLRATAIYKFNPYIGLGAGFRALKVNYSTSDHNTKFKYDAVSYGPLIGIVFTF